VEGVQEEEVFMMEMEEILQIVFSLMEEEVERGMDRRMVLSVLVEVDMAEEMELVVIMVSVVEVVEEDLEEAGPIQEEMVDIVFKIVEPLLL
jgi:hypothetical protein